MSNTLFQACLPGLTGDNIIYATPVQILFLNSANIAWLSKSQLQALKPEQVAAFSDKQISQLSLVQALALYPTQTAMLSVGQTAALNTVLQFPPISLTQDKIDAARTKFNTTAIPVGGSVSSNRINAWTTALSTVGVNIFPSMAADISYMSPEDFSSLNNSQIKGLTILQLQSITHHQLAALSVAQIGRMSPYQAIVMTPYQRQKLSPEQAATLNIAAKLTYKQAAGAIVAFGVIDTSLVSTAGNPPKLTKEFSDTMVKIFDEATRSKLLDASSTADLTAALLFFSNGLPFLVGAPSYNVAKWIYSVEHIKSNPPDSFDYTTAGKTISNVQTANPIATASAAAASAATSIEEVSVEEPLGTAEEIGTAEAIGTAEEIGTAEAIETGEEIGTAEPMQGGSAKRNTRGKNRSQQGKKTKRALRRKSYSRRRLSAANKSIKAFHT